MEFERNVASLRPIGRIIVKLYAAKLYANGDSAGFVWRWWNPLAWILAPLAVIASILVAGIPETISERHDIGFGVSPWFKQHPERLQWIPTRLVAWPNAPRT